MTAQEPASRQSEASAAPTVQKVMLPGQTPKGEPILAVLLKRSYRIVPGKRCVRAQNDRKIVPGDVHYGDPMNSSVKFESDFVPFKLATDVVLNGTAYAPQGKPVQTLTASLIVDRVRKDVLVIGDRIVRSAKEFGEPKPFTKMDLRYENAYGGVDVRSDPRLPCAYPRNHLGKGFVVAATQKALENLRLPNLEDPKNPLTPQNLCCGHFMHCERQPMPQGFGWFSKYWRPRALLGGVMPADRETEQQLRKTYAQVLPPAQRKQYEESRLPDMDFRFFNGASPGLAMPFLFADEKIRAINLAPEGEIVFQLPVEKPRIGLDVGLGLQEPEVVLHTVMIHMDDRELDLVWRAAATYPGPDWLPEMKKMDIQVK